MPPLRSGRASKACDLCRKYKTRCYASENGRGKCLRCETLSHPCSLEFSTPYHRPVSQVDRPGGRVDADSPTPERSGLVDERLERLENAVETLANRLDSRLNALVNAANHNAPGLSNPHSTNPPHHNAPHLSNHKVVNVRHRRATSVGPRQPSPSAGPDSAPVFLIRDAATDAGVHSPQQLDASPVQHSDVISIGLIARPTARSLLSLFHVHYGRWVKFPESISTDALLSQVRKSPLLLCSIFLIAVRHTTQELADKLAPELFEEAKRLVTSSLLDVPQSIEFFQATLILSLWSTTIGQVPLSVDSWLLTGYALQQGLASPDFSEVLQHDSGPSPSNVHFNNWCIWNHLCVAHLQYCVGTRRQALLNAAQIDRCLRFLESDNVTNYETRMVAEVKLYWIIYEKCCGSQVDLPETKLALQDWQHEWAALFNQPRSQFLQMGFHFAHLLAYCQFLKSPRAVINSSILSEMIRLSTSIINLAMDTADDRTRHLTDHIYHTITFAALTLCRVVHTYESKLRMGNHDIGSLDNLVHRLIRWLKSIGLPCHVAHILGDIVSAQFKKLRPGFRRERSTNTNTNINTNTNTNTNNNVSNNGNTANTSVAYETTPTTTAETAIMDDAQSFPEDVAFLYPDFVGSELFDIDPNTAQWPQWDRMYSDTDMSV